MGSSCKSLLQGQAVRASHTCREPGTAGRPAQAGLASQPDLPRWPRPGRARPARRDQGSGYGYLRRDSIREVEIWNPFISTAAYAA